MFYCTLQTLKASSANSLATVELFQFIEAQHAFKIHYLFLEILIK